MITDQPDDMPVFVLKAKDRLALAAVRAYQGICENAGLTGQAAQVALAAREIEAWQRRNPVRLQFPDHTHVPVEGSTPLDSPPRSELVGMLAKHMVALNKLALAAEAYLTRTEADDAVRDRLRIALFDATTDAWLLLRPNPPAPGELVSVPPPVEEILDLVDDVAQARVMVFSANGRSDHLTATRHGDAARRYRLAIETAVKKLFAAGVAEERLRAAVAVDDERSYPIAYRREVLGEFPADVDPQPADEPGPVPPPVDALLRLLTEWVEGDVCSHTAAEWAAGHREIEASARNVWAAGVEEGRRELDAEIHANVLASARQVAAEAGFGPVPDSLTVTYETSPTAYEQGIYDAGVAEGRRQATEERTALVLDTTERTLRTAANWLESDKDSSMLVESANAVKSQGADEACCPVCEEVECDGDCPLATLRTAADGG